MKQLLKICSVLFWHRYDLHLSKILYTQGKWMHQWPKINSCIYVHNMCNASPAIERVHFLWSKVSSYTWKRAPFSENINPATFPQFHGLDISSGLTSREWPDHGGWGWVRGVTSELMMRIAGGGGKGWGPCFIEVFHECSQRDSAALYWRGLKQETLVIETRQWLFDQNLIRQSLCGTKKVSFDLQTAGVIYILYQHWSLCYKFNLF